MSTKPQKQISRWIFSAFWRFFDPASALAFSARNGFNIGSFCCGPCVKDLNYCRWPLHLQSTVITSEKFAKCISCESNAFQTNLFQAAGKSAHFNQSHIKIEDRLFIDWIVIFDMMSHEHQTAVTTRSGGDRYVF